MDFRVLISPYSKFFNPRGWRAITCLEDVSPWRQNLVSSTPGDILLPSSHATQFCSYILCTFPRKGSTLNRIKIILTVRKLTTLRHQYNQKLKHSIHAKSPHPTTASSPFLETRPGNTRTQSFSTSSLSVE